MKKNLKWLVRAAFIIPVLGLCIFSISLSIQKNELEGDLDKSSQKNQMLLQKIREEKSKTAAMAHKSRAIEAQQAKLRDEIGSWEENYRLLESENAELQDQITNQKRQFADKSDALSVKYNKLKLEKDQLQEKYNDSLMFISEQEKEIKKHQKNIASLEAKFKRTNIKLGKCEEKNAKLCEISSGLLDKFENQGVWGSILKNENFVQLKRVEVEKMVQEYQDKIEELNLESIQ